jgi:hypothetical protein
VDQSNAGDIINAATTQGIYDLTLGLSDKERRVLVAGKAHKASAITYGEAKEGAVEAHNFSSKASVTTIHLSNKRKRDARTVASAKMLAKLVYSINTSKVTEVGTEDKKNGNEEESGNNGNPNANKRVAIEGMQIVVGKQNKAMQTETESTEEEEDDDEEDGEDNQGKGEEVEEQEGRGHGGEEEEGPGMDEDQEEGAGKHGSKEEAKMEDSNKWAKINAIMTANMASALAQLNDPSGDEDKEGSGKEEESFNETDLSICSGDHDLSIEEYNPDAVEVSSGIFDAEHSKKYKTPNSFLQALWNAAGPSVGSMIIQLNIIRDKLEGEAAGVDPDFSKIDIQLINFMIVEAGEDTDECIAFIEEMIKTLGKYKEGNKTEAGATPSNVQEGHTNKEILAPKMGGGTTTASKTQGLLPRAPEASLVEETAMETPNMVARDKEGAKSMSMVQSG